MEQTLQGVAFPNAAAAKAELLHHHDTSMRHSPHTSKPKRFERPWMGFGDGKEIVRAQNQMMKRKRGKLSTASIVSVVTATGSESTPRSGEKLELDFLRHDGHFDRSEKKGPVVTFVKQYFRQKWDEHTQESRQVSRSKKLQAAKLRQKIQPMSKVKRWEYGTTKKTTPPVSKNNRLEYATTRLESQPVSKSTRLEHTTFTEDKRPVSKSKRLEFGVERGEIETERMNNRLEYVLAREETESVGRSKGLDYAPVSKSTRLELTTITEDKLPVSRSKRLEFGLERGEIETERVNNRLDYVKAREETESVSRSTGLDYESARDGTEPVSRSKRLDDVVTREDTEPVSWNKQLDYATKKVGPLANESKSLDYATAREETESLSRSKRLDDVITREETQPVSWNKHLDHATPLVNESKSLAYETARKETESVSRSKRLDNASTREETQPVNWNKHLHHETSREETEPVSRSKRLDHRSHHATEKGETPVNKNESLEYAAAREETSPVRRSKRFHYETVREDTESMSRTVEDPTEEEEAHSASKSKRWENIKTEAALSSEYAQTEELEAEIQFDLGNESNILPCGTDCNQIRTDIFKKVNTLMARAKPEKLHIKPRSKTPTLSERDEYEGRTTGTDHHGVHTVSTENKKVQTRYTEPKQVQWAILPKDSLVNSPKVSRVVNEARKPPKEKVLFRDDSILVPYNEKQIFRDDSILMKVSIQPKRQTYSQASSQLPTEAETEGRRMKESQIDSINTIPPKRIKGQHNLLLHQEAMQIQKEQKDLERAREQRRDFWASYERELKRGRGLYVDDYEIERKGKRTTQEDETPTFAEEDPAPMKTKLNAFLDEHLTLTSASRASSSPRDECKSSQEATAIFQELLDKVESYETSPKEADLVGLQGLRKIQSIDNLQSLEAMEKQLNPETSQPPGQLSPTELDCMKAAILSHNFYPRLVTSFINQHKANAPPDQVERLERIRQQVIKSWRPSDSPDGTPAQREKIKKYQDILTKFERELERPFSDAMDFSWQMEHYLDTITLSRGRSEIGSSGSNNLKDFDDGQDLSRY